MKSETGLWKQRHLMPLISEALKWRGSVSLISEVVIRGNCVSDFRASILENECCWFQRPGPLCTKPYALGFVHNPLGQCAPKSSKPYPISHAHDLCPYSMHQVSLNHKSTWPAAHTKAMHVRELFLVDSSKPRSSTVEHLCVNQKVSGSIPRLDNQLNRQL